jgi:hypothetical protein
VLRTGFETEIDISSARHSSLVRAKAVSGEGKTLAWTDAADGNAGYFQAPDLADTQAVTSDAPSSATGVATTSSTVSAFDTSASDPPASSAQAGAASPVRETAAGVLLVLAGGVGCALVLFCWRIRREIATSMYIFRVRYDDGALAGRWSWCGGIQCEAVILIITLIAWFTEWYTDDYSVPGTWSVRTQY